MEVTDKLIENLANLARLHFDDSEMNSIKNDLDKMIAFVEKLKEIDTSGTEPLLHMGANNDNIYREDIVQGSMSKTTALQNAPDSNNDFFKVPKVIQK